MRKPQPKISYDKQSKALSIKLDRAKSVDSDINGNVVVDYDKNGRIICINIYNLDFDSFRRDASALQNFIHARSPLAVKEF